MGRGQTEEAGESGGRDFRVLALQRAPEHLGPDVDAEHRMQQRTLRACRDRRCPRRRQRAGQPALGGPLRRVLKHRVDGVGGAGPHRQRMGRGDAPPGVGDAILETLEQGDLPGHADGQQIAHGLVGAIGQLGLPEPLTGELRPAAEAEQKLVEVALQGGRGQPEARGEPGDGVHGIVRQGGDETRKPGEPEDFRRQVVNRLSPVGRPRPLTPGRCPQRLAGVEVACGPGADAIRGHRRPVGAVRAGGQLRHRRQRRRRIRRRSGRPLQGRQVGEVVALRRSVERAAQVVVADHALVDGVEILAPRSGQPEPADPLQPRRRPRQRFPGLTEKRVDRHGGRQRPRWRDLPGRGIDGASQRVEVDGCRPTVGLRVTDVLGECIHVPSSRWE